MPRPRRSVVSVGDAILDVVTPPVPATPGDAQSQVERFHFLPGGNATNFALAVRALGEPVDLVACVGDDWAAANLRGAFERAKVDVHLKVDPDTPTGLTLAITAVDGSRHLITSPGANGMLTLGDIPLDLATNAAHLHRAGFWWCSALTGHPTAQLLRIARQEDVETSLDTATDPHGWTEDRRKAVLEVLPHVTVLFANEAEVRGISGETDPTAAAATLREAGVEEVVVHQGAKGSTAYTGGKPVTVKAFEVTPANPTGCGDVFNAAYVFGRMKAWDVRRRLTFANASAAKHLEDLSTPYPVETVVRDRFKV